MVRFVASFCQQKAEMVNVQRFWNRDIIQFSSVGTHRWRGSLHPLRDGLKAVLSKQRSRQRQRRGKAAMPLTEARQGRGRGRARGRGRLNSRQGRGEVTPEKPSFLRCIAVPNLVALSQTV